MITGIRARGNTDSKPKLLTDIKYAMHFSVYSYKTIEDYIYSTIDLIIPSDKTTLIYTHVVKQGAGIISPLDRKSR